MSPAVQDHSSPARSSEARGTARRWLFRLGLAAILAFIGAASLYFALPFPPDSRQDSRRIEQIRGLDLVRSGRVRTRVIDLTKSAPPGSASRILFSLSTPETKVDDAEIRGYLTGDVKYGVNQGTAFHFRVGRRFDAAHKGLYELKRSLLRWEAPPLPEGARVVSASVNLWVEQVPTSSPLYRGSSPYPLYLYLYSIREGWTEGDGGVLHNNFSPAAVGEVTWNEARQGRDRWPAPGGLASDTLPGIHRYLEDAIAVAVIPGSHRPLAIESSSLARHVEACARSERPVSVLMKLGDGAEDRPGTEVGFFSSEFGDSNDAESKRPRLDLLLDVPHPDLGASEDFILEPGSDHLVPPARHAGATVLLGAELTCDGPGVPPAVFVRGGTGDVDPAAPWIRLRSPQRRRWDWSQVRLASPPLRLTWGDTFHVSLREFWVHPGPRQRQSPELALLSPSGQLHRVRGIPVAGEIYRMEFTPDEPGLWRYGWAFRPTPDTPPGSHEGEGIFYVEPAPLSGESEYEALARWGRALASRIERRGAGDPGVQVSVNALCRWAGQLSQRGSERRDALRRVVRELRQRLSESARL